MSITAAPARALRKFRAGVVPLLLGGVLALAPAAGAPAAVPAVPVDLGIANAAAPAFSPDGRSVYVGMRKGLDGAAIVKLTRQGKGWSAPMAPGFADGTYRDLEPAFAPDGGSLVFASNRPAMPGGAVLDGHYNGALQAGKGGALWRVEFAGGVPGAPVRLPDLINSTDSVFSPAPTADGSLYFMRADEDGAKFHIFRAQFRKGKFDEPIKAPFTDARYGDYDPAVPAHESFLIFSSGRPPAPQGGDLFIVFRKGISWSEPSDLRTALSPDVYGFEPRLSPDGKTLYFVNSHAPSGVAAANTRYLWKIDLSALLQANGVV